MFQSSHSPSIPSVVFVNERSTALNGLKLICVGGGLGLRLGASAPPPQAQAWLRP